MINTVTSHIDACTYYTANQSYPIVEGAGTPIPRPLVTVVATDLDEDPITFAINPASVSAALAVDSS